MNSLALKEIARELLFSPEPEHQRIAAIDLYRLFSRITGIQRFADHPQDSIETVVPAGKAISPADAASCILDFARTVEFLRGAYAALRAAKSRFSERPIEVLYAGCGPFAALAVPLATQFTADEVQFTLVDMHDRSLHCAQHLFRVLGLSDFVRQWIRADAASYVHDSGKPLHMVVTETMQRALENEPQVAIVLNLAPQLCPNGILVPEKISIDACLFDLNEEFVVRPFGSNPALAACGNSRAGRRRLELGQVFEITAKSAHDLRVARKDGALLADDGFPPIVLDVPRPPNTPLHLMLRTTITVFGTAVLHEYESGITQPLILHALGVARPGGRIAIQYVLGEKPGFKCWWVCSEVRA